MAKYATIILIILFASIKAAGGEWIKESRTGCKIWNPSPVANESVTWIGGCVNGYIEGRGVMTVFLDGIKSGSYEGECKQGKFNGQGVYISTNGMRYDGNWKDSQYHGFGTFIMAKGYKPNDAYKDKGRWVGDNFIIKGQWEKGNLISASENTPTLKSDALLEAAKKGDTATVRQLVKSGMDVNSRGEYGSTALMQAAGWQRLETVIALIQMGADVKATNDSGDTALLKACESYSNRNERVVEALIKAGADVNGKGPTGVPMLIVAASAGNVEALRNNISWCG